MLPALCYVSIKAQSFHSETISKKIQAVSLLLNMHSALPAPAVWADWLRNKRR